MEDTIRIKDKRRGLFIVDNYILDFYGKDLGSTGIAFYVTLCRYANRETQQAFPSITKIHNLTGMNRTTIIEAAKRAERLKLIKRKVIPRKYTLYTLLEPKRKHWSEIGLTETSGPISSNTGPILTPLVRFTKRTNEEERMKITTETLKKRIRDKYTFLNK